MNRIQKIIQEILQEKKVKRDRCLRIADRKFDKPSAYKSGAVVRCRKGDIWKGLKEEILSNLTKIEPYNDPDDEYSQDLDDYLEDDNIDWRKESYITLLNPNQIQPSEWNSLSDDPKNPKSIKYSKIDPSKFPPILALYIMTRYITLTNPAGWDEYDKYSIGELIDEGYDGVILPEDNRIDYLVFDPKSISKNIKETNDPQSGKAAPYGSGYSKLKEIIQEIILEDESLHKWFKRSGAPGKEGGWVDCNSPIRKDGKITGYKACGRKEGEKRAKYPSCRPTAAKCKDKGKGKKWGKTK
jgi:hypothetical protein